MAGTDTIEPSSAGLPVEPHIYRCGTLSYTQEQLYVLFFWLMWNDASIMLMENVNGFSQFIQRDLGATNAQIAVFSTIGGLFNLWINPFFSVWSDRTRTRWGRRRPFLFLSTPPLALCILGIPYMPTVYHYLLRFPLGAAFFQHVPMPGGAFLVGICVIMLSIFNAMVLAIFSYLYWDVVPQEVLGRWTSLTRIAGSVVTILWGFFLRGLADKHMKALCVSVSLFCLVAYLLSTFKVKEGQYPAVDRHNKGGPYLAPIRAYVVECFSDPFYLWIFAAFAVAGISSGMGTYIDRYLKYDLHLSYDQMGKFQAAPYFVPVILGYFLGAMADRLHPMRIFAPSFFFWGMVSLGSYFFVHDQWSYLFWSCLTQVAIFANGVTYGALLPAIYPRAKFGQFCSANQLCGSLTGAIVSIPFGYFFDWIKNYRVAYLVSAVTLFAGAILFLKVQRNYEKRHGRVPLPQAG